MTPVGPDVFEEFIGFPFIERASVRRRTIVSEMSVIPPVDALTLGPRDLSGLRPCCKSLGSQEVKRPQSLRAGPARGI
jgi:hypothetical protein